MKKYPFILLFSIVTTLGSGSAQAQYKLHDTFNCLHAGLSKQFDIEFRIKHYVSPTPQGEYDRLDSIATGLFVVEKKTGKQLDIIDVLPAPLGMSFYREQPDRSDATSYSTGFNAGRKLVDNYLGTIIVADLNFDGRDDIAAVEDSGASSGPYYAFFIQHADGKFVRDDFLGETMMYFPAEIDTSRRRLTTYSPANAYETCRSVFELSRATGEWRMVVREIMGEEDAGGE